MKQNEADRKGTSRENAEGEIQEKQRLHQWGEQVKSQVIMTNQARNEARDIA
jgi:hypothetical protein